MARGDRVRFASEDPACLVLLRDQLRDRRVRAAARRLLLRSEKASSAELLLNKQAASVGIVVLCGSPEESPMGPIRVRIRSGDLGKVVDWLTAYEEG